MTTVQAASATTIPTGTWGADKTHSSVEFSVKHAVVAKFRGGFTNYDAGLSDKDGTPTLRGEAGVASVDVKDETLNGHLLSPDFFDAERYPAIVFESTELRREGEELIAEGDLTIKGVTKRVQARGEIAGPAVYMDDSERIGIELETVVDRTDYGLDWNAPLPKGGVAVQDEVTIKIALELVKESD